jgi:hypothetical protein
MDASRSWTGLLHSQVQDFAKVIHLADAAPGGSASEVQLTRLQGG